MIEMDEQFQREFAAAMAQLRAVAFGLVNSAGNARGEARMMAAGEDDTQTLYGQLANYEVGHAYWTAYSRLVPVITSFEDADRRAASLMENVDPTNPLASATPVRLAAIVEQLSDELATEKRATEVFQQRTHYLEGQLARLDTAVRGRPATIDERIRETESAEDLVDAVLRLVADTQWKSRYEQEKSRADTLAETTSAAAKLLGVTTLPEILTALESLTRGTPFDFQTLVEGSLIAGQWAGSFEPGRKVYVGRFVKQRSDGSAKIDRICTLCDDHADAHVVSTDLAESTVRLPTADEIIAFGKMARKTGLLRLPTDGDE
jgi:hypothetical protein